MSNTSDSDPSDQAFVDPFDYGFDEEAASKYSEWQRLLDDVGDVDAESPAEDSIEGVGVETMEKD